MSLQPWLSPQSGPCVCSQIRRTARKVSAFYDQALRESNLTITQYAVLVNVGRAGQISRTALAAQLGMDRTTLTRNLLPLEKQGFIVAAESRDLRQRLLRLSPSGNRKLRASYELWETAQASFAASAGPALLSQLRQTLKAAEAAVETSNIHMNESDS